MKLQTLKFGSDAEYFVRTINKIPFPVCGLIGGTKEAPLPLHIYGVPEKDAGYAVQEDNCAAEVNVPATASFPDLLDSLVRVLQHVELNYLPPTLKLDLGAASVVFPSPFLTIPQANVFGCEPDFNAWDQSINKKPHPKKEGFRTAAAHVHVSWDDPTDEEKIEFVRMADALVVCGQLGLENDSEKARRELYGRAGAFRPKNYGVEHRVLSNLWPLNRDRALGIMKMYFGAAALVSTKFYVDKTDYKLIEDAINGGEVKIADQIFNKYYERLTTHRDIKKFTGMLQPYMASNLTGRGPRSQVSL